MANNFWNKYDGNDITIEKSEVMGLLQQYLKRPGKAVYNTNWNKLPEDIDRQVAEKYDEFLDILASAETTIGGDVLSHLKAREVFDRREGDFITDPIAGLTTGDGLGYSNRSKGLALEVNVGLDISASMETADGLDLHYSGNKGNYYTVNTLGMQNPLMIAPRIFFASLCARFIHNAMQNSAEELGASLKAESFTWAGGSSGELTQKYDGDVWFKHPRFGGWTNLTYFLLKMQQKEIEHGHHNAHRLDLVITDAQFNLYDEQVAINHDRIANGGSVQTVIMGIAGMDTPHHIPDTFIWYKVDSPRVLAQVMQTVVQEFLQSNA